jgi:hypothetical protein
VAIGHDQAVIAYHSLTFAGGTAMDGDKLTYGGVIADDGVGFLATELEVLWIAADHCAGIDMAVFANACAAVDGNIIVDHSTLANLYIVVDARECANSNRWMKFCFWMNKIHKIIYDLTIYNLRFIYGHIRHDKQKACKGTFFFANMQIIA